MLAGHYARPAQMASSQERSWHFNDHFTLSSTLTACANLRYAASGNQLHAYSIQTGLKAYTHVGNTLLSFYAKSKDLVSVQRVFNEIENPDVYSWTTLLSACTKLGQIGYACHLFNQTPRMIPVVWNAIITGCAENKHTEIALNLFREMHQLGVRHDKYTFASVLSLCSLELLDFGREVHTLVIKTGFLVRASVINALLTMYFTLEKLQMHMSVGRDEEALIMFKEMQEACLRPTELTFVSVMSSCSSARVSHQVHAQAIKMGFEACTPVSNAAMTMYSSCGNLHAVHMVFDRLEEKDLISWNIIIMNYAQGNFYRLAILAFLQMQRAGIEPDEFTIGSLLASSESLEIVKMFQALVSKNGLNSKIEVSNALVSAFSKHGQIEQAYQGLEQFYELLMSTLKPNAYTLSIVLSICASISALRHGKQIHGYILRSGVFSVTSLGNALITMYAKCGDLDWSLRIFNVMNGRDIVSWNAMISAYAQHGKGKEAVHFFKAMQDSGGVKPDQATFTAVLSACSHAGLVDDGTRIFNSMVNDYGFEPGADHLSCIVDLLGRAGYLEEAERLINSKHLKIVSSIWWTLFSACAAHGNLRLGRIVAGFLLEIEQNDPAVYVLLSNIYAAAGQWEEAANTRDLMQKTRVAKQPGCSWIGS
ncbi:Pentatricopeptide repeat-containing protein [Vitis vinifera]|uniref:Pentatricopeptide repeat-containing protein n=1 Tax=Vitis vinifera TaxID=29760 RepID=A0A438KPS5_VITVI|nr:Pentatricopeptide repeat-containing protein [Vitis vinifera]